MSNVLFISDLHLGHRTILEHTAKVEGAYRGGLTLDEHDTWVVTQCLKAKPNKRTVWYLLGDVAMSREKLHLLAYLPGRRRLVMGNHDILGISAYTEYFESVAAILKKYGMWITHAPMHPEELRGKPNVHGHCHHHNLRNDPRYFNCAIEWLPRQVPISLDQLREVFKQRGVL